MIPKKVIQVAEDRSSLGGKLKLFGKYKDCQVYSYEYSEPVTVGLPVIYLWDGSKVGKMIGENALSILSSI